MNFSLDALSLPLQWLIILPLFLIIVLGIWFQQSRLIKEGFYNDKKGETWQQRGHVGKVVSTLSLGD